MTTENATVKELFEKLSSSQSGLSALEAKEGLQQYGYNEIAEKKANSIIKFSSYFWTDSLDNRDRGYTLDDHLPLGGLLDNPYFMGEKS